MAARGILWARFTCTCSWSHGDTIDRRKDNLRACQLCEPTTNWGRNPQRIKSSSGGAIGCGSNHGSVRRTCTRAKDTPISICTLPHMLMSSHVVMMNRDVLEGWSMSSTLATIHYRRFINNFAAITKPLHRGWRRKAVSSAGRKHVQMSQGFEALAHNGTNPSLPGLHPAIHPAWTPCNASGTRIGAVLSQVQDGEEQVKDDTVTRRELLAVVTFI